MREADWDEYALAVRNDAGVPIELRASAICGDRRLLPGRFRIQVPSQFHGVVKHPSDHEQCWLNTVDQEVTRPADYARGCVHLPPTQSQMP